ncbi:alpha/beta fold hydrolase [Actinomycetospora corticicola]|uniref:Pimeloyl-ACP methyl ester carboxylesterase n=1 Tax=Actinomycetospora corticicola TaxID=663602 RepID=A0A7Y9DXX5_9PSEU|nr:alpha/beta hydrolase [Actinomycetospora corticicola]NYD37466.1 pimeloyl-ACP methyl ester carboxylesterase [Actinomycetospora corticicola]
MSLIRSTQTSPSRTAGRQPERGSAVGQQLDGIADDVTHVSVPGCGHLVPEEQPDALADHLTAFDDGCRR